MNASRGWRFLLPIVALVVSLALVACGSDDDDGGGSTAASTTATDTGGGGSGPEVVWLEQGSGNPYWDAQHNGAAEAGRRLGFAFRAVSGNLDPSDQAATMRRLVDQNVNTIMLNAIDPKAMAPALRYAQEKGVNVVDLYGSDPLATANIEFDENKVGEVAAQNALDLLEQRYGKPEGKVAVLTGILGQPVSDQRARGFTDYMAKQDGVEVVSVQPTEWQADKASATMQNWLTKYPDLSLVYSLSDTLAVPAMNVAQRQNRLCTRDSDWEDNEACVAFVSVDGIFLREVVDGRLMSTQLFSPEWTGYKMGSLAGSVANGKPFERENLLNGLLVTDANAACVQRMQDAMTNDTASFEFDGTLQEIAADDYGCQLVDDGA